MAQPSAPEIELTVQQQQTLEAIVRKRTNPQQIVLRAQIILYAAQGRGIRETARALRVGREVVQRWRRRWGALSEVADVAARLADAPRPGAPATYTPEQICAIVALACERPEDRERPITHWTQQELAAEAVKRGVVAAISQRSVGRFLKRSGPPPPSGAGVAEHRKRCGI
jgi:putative transposase